MKTPLPPPTGGPYRGNGGSEVKRYFAKPLFFSPKSFFLLFLFARARLFFFLLCACAALLPRNEVHFWGTLLRRLRTWAGAYWIYVRYTSEVHFCVLSGPGLEPIRDMSQAPWVGGWVCGWVGAKHRTALYQGCGKNLNLFLNLF